jgi:hypothetical protein
MLTRLVVVVSIALALLVACSASDAVDVPTSAIQPQFRIVSSANGDTTVRVDLFRSGFGSDRLRLTGGDALTVSVDGGPATTLTLQSDGTLNQHYAATLTGVAIGSDLVIALTRFGEESAPETRVEIPTAPAVTAPTAGASFTAGADFEVAWEPFAEDSVEVRFALTACADLEPDEAAILAAIVALPGGLTAGSAGTVQKSFASAEELECTADLLVGRVTTDVTLDPAFAGLRGTSRIVREAEPIDLLFAP